MPGDKGHLSINLRQAIPVDDQAVLNGHDRNATLPFNLYNILRGVFHRGMT